MHTGPPAERERPHVGREQARRAAPWRRGLLVALGHLGEPAEGVGVPYREVGEDLPVDLDAALLEPGHQAAVAQAVDACRRIDARDPERAELRLLLAPVAIRVSHGALGRLLRRLVELAPAAASAF